MEENQSEGLQRHTKRFIVCFYLSINKHRHLLSMTVRFQPVHNPFQKTTLDKFPVICMHVCVYTDVMNF